MKEKSPQGWVKVQIKDIAETQSGGTPSTARKEYWDGDVPWINSGKLKDGVISEPSRYITALGLKESSARLFPKNTVVIALTGATTGKVGFLGFETSTNQSVTGIFPNDFYISKILFYQLVNLRKQILNKALGTAQPHINKRIVDETVVNVPPLAEQKRIADKLDKLFGHLDIVKTKLDRIPELLKQFRQQVLTQAVTGMLTEEWRNDPEVWQMLPLKSLVNSISYGTSKKSENSGTIPVLRMGNLQNGKIDWADLKFTSDKIEEEKYALVKGDVLFNRTNSPELVGKTSIYEGEQPAIYAGYLIRIKCSNNLNPYYLNYVLNSPYGRDWSWKVKSDGVSQSNINAKKLSEFLIPYPSLEEQQEIIKRIGQLFAIADNIEQRYNVLEKKAEAMPHAMLSKAFRGELVPQSPDDEPASELLKRIQAMKNKK
jgi:type I restriction enzyme, S subunit